MYKLNKENLQKLMEVNNWLNQVEVKGFNNCQIISVTGTLLSQVIQYAEQNEFIEENNTKKGE